MKGSNASKSGLQLVLNTWLTMYLHDGERGRPGGLPNDFLTHGSAALLLFDSVICDREAFEAEQAFKGIWLSSDLFAALQSEGVLQLADFKREFLTTEFLEHLDREGYKQAALEVMEREAHSIRESKGSLGRLALPSLLTWLNHYMFMGLRLPNHLRYEWQEHHFKPTPDLPRAALPGGVSSVGENDTLAIGKDVEASSRLMKAVGALLPEFQLLPPLPAKGAARQALRQNIRLEKPALYRWIYGDPEIPRERYQEIRRQAAFRRLDARIDEGRRAVAFQNLDLLLEVRSRTRDLRAGVQTIFRQVADGTKELRDVQAEIAEFTDAVESRLPSTRRIAVDVALAGTGLAVKVAGVVASLAGAATVGVPATALGFGLGAYGFWSRYTKRRDYKALRQDYPLAWLVRDFKMLKGKQLRRLTPRRYR